MRLLGKIFPLRRCRRHLTGEPAAERPCLNFQMKRCLGPCRGAAEVSAEEYARMVEQVVLFLEGRRGFLERQLEEKMRQAAQEERFEEAARLRDQLQAVRRVTAQQQKVLLLEQAVDWDILALARQDAAAAVHLFIIREAHPREHFSRSSKRERLMTAALGAFISHIQPGGVRRGDLSPTSPMTGKSREWLRSWRRQGKADSPRAVRAGW